MKKFIVLLLLLLMAKPFNLFSDLPLAIGLDYSNFNKQNQVIGNISITNKEDFISRFEVANITLGFDSYFDKSPDFIYKLILINLDLIKPIFQGRAGCIEGTNGELAFCVEPDSKQKYSLGFTLLNYDKTQIINELIQWAQIRGGIGIITEGGKFPIRYCNFDGLLSMKLGYSSINFGEYNFRNFNDNYKYFNSLESGLNLNMNLKYKKLLNFKTDIDFTFFITENMINKISFGLGFDYFDYFHSSKYKSKHDDILKFSIGLSYNKYYFENNFKEFLKIDICAKYFFRF